MENVEIKEEKKEEKKAPKAAAKKMKKDAKLAAFMEDRNAKRKAAKLDPAYSEEEIKAYK